MTLKHFLTFLLLALLGISCVTGAQLWTEDTSEIIRVALMQDAEHVTLEVKDGYKIIDPPLGRVLMEGRRLALVPAQASRNGIRIGDYDFPLAHIRIEAAKEFTLIIHNRKRRFCGSLDLIRTPTGKLLAVNRLPLESYIRGVLYHEVSHRWPLEAIKAQAVATRTYALYHKYQNGQRNFDLTNDIYSQVYGGRTSERFRTNLAVERTEGEVLMYQGQLIPAYFHATCGGHTEDVTALWNHQPLPPLKGITCIYCQHSPHFHWKQKLDFKEIEAALRAAGFKIHSLEDIRVLDRNSSGRIKRLELMLAADQTVKISGKDFRQAVGPNRIKSNVYQIAINGQTVQFTGRGWGHGVGLCQWGAQKMAQRHYNYFEILQYYYPGTTIVRSIPSGRDATQRF